MAPVRLGILSLEGGVGISSLLPLPFSHVCDALGGDCTAQALHTVIPLPRYPYRGTRTRTRTFEHALLPTFERDHAPDEEDTLDSLVSDSDSSTGCNAGATDFAAARRACSA